MVSLMTVFVKLPFKRPCPSVLSSDYCSLSFSQKLSSLLTTLKLFTPISHGSVPALVGNCGQWASGNEQWAIGHMAYCGQLPVKWVRRCLCVSRQVVEVELIHAGVEL